MRALADGATQARPHMHEHARADIVGASWMMHSSPRQVTSRRQTANTPAVTAARRTANRPYSARPNVRSSGPTDTPVACATALITRLPAQPREVRPLSPWLSANTWPWCAENPCHARPLESQGCAALMPNFDDTCAGAACWLHSWVCHIPPPDRPCQLCQQRLEPGVQGGLQAIAWVIGWTMCRTWVQWARQARPGTGPSGPRTGRSP